MDGTWAGVSLTMPLKRAAVPLLHEATRLARATGCVNTITISGGRLLGDNTDVAGMLGALADAGITRAGPACVLGAGATAATALAALHALGCPAAVAIARDPARAGPLEAAAQRIGIPLRVRPWDEARRHLGAALVISAVPPGAASPLAPWWPGPEHGLLDVAYQQPSALAESAARAGSTVASGLAMLVHQAARQFEVQAGRPAPLGVMLAAAARALASRESKSPRRLPGRQRGTPAPAGPHQTARPLPRGTVAG